MRLSFSLLANAAVALTATLALNACADSKHSDIKELVARTLECSYNPENKLKIVEINEPDSTFGVKCLPEKELERIAANIDDISKYIMEKTHDMTDFNPNDGKTAFLANQQMQASAQITDLFAYSQSRRPFNGWYVRALYTVTFGKQIIKMQKWFFINKQGDLVYHTFELAVP